MSVLVVGSVGYDTVSTPVASGKDLLGGSATYFSLSASRFTEVSLVAVVGKDFREAHLKLLGDHKVDTSGLEVAEGKTFRWSGRYRHEDVNSRDTLDTQLNVFAGFKPKLRPEHRRKDYLFLANIDPVLQMEVLGQMERRPKLVGMDTMNFWIEGKRDALAKVIGSVDVVFMDEGEVRSYARESNLVKAARAIMGQGPKTVVAKRGEHGVLLVTKDSVFAAPAFPLDTVVDPTGAGDTFAGGFMGYLASTGNLSHRGFRRATVLGSVMGSFVVESLSADRLLSLDYDALQSRFRAFTALTSFEELKAGEGLPWRGRNGRFEKGTK
ncbi:MAG: sugar kinase [SAR202 cluster bacterium]|nr:sugar kinase [SAR202 cluster bacterium]